MKGKWVKRAAIGVVAVAALYVAYDQFKNDAIDWYLDRYYERQTATPSSETPDQVCLTWSGDPATTMTVNWRTSSAIAGGQVEYRPKDVETDPLVVETGTFVALEDKLLVNDSINHRFNAVLTGLSAGMAYAYRIATPEGTTTDWAQFVTTPERAKDFSFIYLGDAQEGLGEWGNLIHAADERHPNAAFWVIAGDLVNSGNWRNEWDDFFAAGKGIFERKPLVPALGNHDVDDQSRAPEYLGIFGLPTNGPKAIESERAYSLTYGNALVVVLDSTLPAVDQTEWLEETLASSDATWKIAVYHHPSYASRRKRDNEEVRELWGAIFDKYHVDLALTGHDHAYLRTYPMKGGKRVESAADGTYYVVSVSGTKFYEQEPHDYAEAAFAEVMTYQVIEIGVDPDRLEYRAYDIDGGVRDEIAIKK